MLADEYKLIDISLISCSSGWTNPGWPGQVSRATENNINYINFTPTVPLGHAQRQFGLTLRQAQGRLLTEYQHNLSRPIRKQKAQAAITNSCASNNRQ